MEVPIDHEIHPEYFEIVSLLLWVDHQRASLYWIGGDFLHFGVHFVVEIVSSVVLLIEVLLKLLIADFVAFLILAVLRQVLLHCVIGEVNRCEAMLNRILEGGSPNIPQLVPVSLNDPIDWDYHHVVPNIKFPLLVQKWFL